MEANGKQLRVKEAASRLGVSARTVWRLIAEGELPIVHVRKCACVSEVDLEAYIGRSKRRVCA